MKYLKLIFISIIYCLTLCCSNKKDLYHLPTFNDANELQAVIEIPGGTNKKYEYNVVSQSFEIDMRDGMERIINFISYPGNYGFIPSTLSNLDEGGDGDALDVIILSESIPTGTVISIKPIGILKIVDNKELDYKIIAIPKEEKLQTISPISFNEFERTYPKAKEILALWFTNYDKKDSLYIAGWGNEKEALIEINKSLSN